MEDVDEKTMDKPVKMTNKEGDVKLVDMESIVSELRGLGWSLDGESVDDGEEDSLEQLQQEATELGITFHHKAGKKRLREMIDAFHLKEDREVATDD